MRQGCCTHNLTETVVTRTRSGDGPAWLHLKTGNHLVTRLFLFATKLRFGLALTYSWNLTCSTRYEIWPHPELCPDKITVLCWKILRCSAKRICQIILSAVGFCNLSTKLSCYQISQKIPPVCAFFSYKMEAWKIHPHCSLKSHSGELALCIVNNAWLIILNLRVHLHIARWESTQVSQHSSMYGVAGPTTERSCHLMVFGGESQVSFAMWPMVVTHAPGNGILHPCTYREH